MKKLKSLGVYGASFSWEPQSALCVGSLGKAINAGEPWWGWVTDLRLRLRNTHTVTNYSQVGSSMNYSYHQFCQTQHLHDHVIFVTSNWGRLWLPHASNPRHQHIPGLEHISAHAGINKKNWPRSLLCAELIYEYQLLEQNDQRMNWLMLGDIQKTRPDLVFLPSCEISETIGPDLTFDLGWHGSTLNSLQMHDQRYWGIADSPPGYWFELRLSNHMTRPQNQALATVFENWLRGAELDSSRFSWVEPDRDVDYYMTEVWK
jgi:hypothetical protein